MVKLTSNAHGYWAFACLVTGLSGIILMFDNAGRDHLVYQRQLLINGEFWRAITGHLTHLGWSHFLLNAFGLFGVWGLYGKTFNIFTWTIIFLSCAIGISIGFVIFDSKLEHYVGLSGVLHGLLGAGAIYHLLSKKWREPGFPAESLFVLAALCLKISYEQFIGSIPLTRAMSGGEVVINSHLYGAVIGILAAGVVLLLAAVRVIKD